MKQYFNKYNEKEEYLLSDDEVKEIDKFHNDSFLKYDSYSTQELINLSHNNLSWIKARKDLCPDEPCRDYLDEDSTFIEFKN